MNGKLNMAKTLVAILMYDNKGQLKRNAQPGEVWSAEHHISDKILVVNKVVRQHVKDLEAAVSTGMCATEGDKQQAATLLDRLKQRGHFEVQVLDPYDEVKYLGVWVQPTMFCKRPVAEATKQAEQVAGALASTAIEAWEAMPVARCTGGQRVCYSLRCVAVLPRMMPRIDTMFRETMKHKHGHCRSFPNHAFDATQYDSLQDQILVIKVVMPLRMVNIKHPAASAVKGMMWQTQRCYGMHV